MGDSGVTLYNDYYLERQLLRLLGYLKLYCHTLIYRVNGTTFFYIQESFLIRFFILIRLIPRYSDFFNPIEYYFFSLALL